MGMSEWDARGPEDHEHLLLISALEVMSATGVARSVEKEQV